jgi:hypothetical protein
MNATTWFLTAAVFVFVVYDIFAAIHWGAGATISRDILQIADTHPILPFAIGVLMGHLFWPQR